jgi:hypothetical protein
MNANAPAHPIHYKNATKMPPLSKRAKKTPAMGYMTERTVEIQMMNPRDAMH